MSKINKAIRNTIKEIRFIESEIDNDNNMFMQDYLNKKLEEERKALKSLLFLKFFIRK